MEELSSLRSSSLAFLSLPFKVFVTNLKQPKLTKSKYKNNNIYFLHFFLSHLQFGNASTWLSYWGRGWRSEGVRRGGFGQSRSIIPHVTVIKIVFPCDIIKIFFHSQQDIRVLSCLHNARVDGVVEYALPVSTSHLKINKIQ